MNWQPMESAPKDGTEVLLYSGNKGMEVAYFSKDSWGRDVWYTNFSCADWGQITIDDPTHWMPLPSEPK